MNGNVAKMLTKIERLQSHLLQVSRVPAALTIANNITEVNFP